MPGYNAVLVKYRPDGTASWARSVTAGTDVSIFEGVTASGSTVYAAGAIDGAGNPYNFGGGPVTGGYSGGVNAVLVQYR
jgi:hypothetical protein